MAGRGTDIKLGGDPEVMAKMQVDPAVDPEGYEQILAEFRQSCAEEKEKVLNALFEFEDNYLKSDKSDFVFGIYQKK